MRNTLETRLGFFFALAIIAAFVLLEMIGVGDFLKKGYRLRAQFNTAQELKRGDPVKLAGVPIGRVENVVLTNNRVEVIMKIRNGSDVKTDSKATIRFTGLMGQNFVAVNFGSPNAPIAAPDSMLETIEQPDLSSLMAKLENVASGVENLTKNFSPEGLSTLFGPVTDFLKENSPKFSAILGNVQNISGEIAEGKGTVGRLVMEDELYRSALSTVTNLETAIADVKSAVQAAKDVVTNINEGQGTLGKLAKDETVYNETATAMTNLREILQKINQGQGSVGRLVNDDSFYKNVKLTLQKVDKATEGIEDQGPLNVLGMAIGSLF